MSDRKNENILKRYIREYRVMTNSAYRLITNILIPLLAVLPSVISVIINKSLALEVGIVIVYFLFMFCEVIGDYFCFGCMCRKNSFGMDFLKTGYNGINYFEHAILVDILIRPVRICITVLIGMIPFIQMGVSIWSVFDIIVITAITSVAALNVTRYIGMGQYVMIASYVLMAPGLAGVYGVIMYGERFKFIAPLLAVALIAVIAATYYHMSARIRMSYIDC